MHSQRFDIADFAQQLFKGFTLPADGDFLAPTGLLSAIADRAIDKPADFAGIELKGRTLPAPVRRTCFHLPAFPVQTYFSSQEIEYLALGMIGDGPPALFVTMDGLDRCT